MGALAAKDVSAVIVTRGDVDLSEILEPLPFDDVIVWDNSTKDVDYKVYGRYVAADRLAKHKVIFFVDDDVVFSNFDALLAAYEPGQITSNMPSPWYERTGYDGWRCGMVGAGSLVPKGIWRDPFDLYFRHYPRDDDFLNGCDWVNGVLSPHTRHDFGYRILDVASAPGRLWTSSEGANRRQTLLERATALRDR